MHRYDFDIAATLRLRELISEYGRMHRLEGMIPQRRGQRFNAFIAELLGCWGVDRVQSNVLGTGEIDVAFAVDGTRFVLEAKWEQGAVSIDPIAKLSRRISQRLAGTRGVFLSMSGYTADVLRDIRTGQQPDTLLLDRTHLDALLSGLLSPRDLFTELVDRASYQGEIYTPLKNLLIAPDVCPLPSLSPGIPTDHKFAIVSETAPGVHANVVLHGTSTQPVRVDGLAFEPGGRLLLTTPQGVARADPASGAIDWAVPVAGCRRNALVLDDGSILVLHGTTVLRWHQNEFQIVAGGFTGGTSLLYGPGRQPWVFDYKGAAWLEFGLVVTLTRLSAELGQEERHVIDFNAGIWNAVWLSAGRFFLASDGHFGVVDLNNPSTVPIVDHLKSPHPNQVGAIRLDDSSVMTTSRHGTLYRIDVETGHSALVARFEIPPYFSDLVEAGTDHAYVLHHLVRGADSYYPVIIDIKGYAKDS